MSINRRQFLKGFGTFSLALPHMVSLMSKEALAQVLASPSAPIFIGMISPNAIDDTAWFPQVTGGWEVLSNHAKRISLSQFSTSGASRIFDATYSSQYKNYTLIRGLGLFAPKPGHQHGALCFGSHYGIQTTVPTGWIHNPTLDKVLENSPKFYGSDTPVIKNLSVSTAQTHGASYSADGVRSPCYTDPKVLFDLLFGTTTSSGSNTSSIFNSVMSDYNRVRNDSRISYSDGLLLQERMDMFSDLQNSLNVIPGGLCAPPATPASFAKLSTKNKSGVIEDIDTNAHVNAMVQISLAAIKCGLTRILMWNELMPMGLLHYLHHDSSHGGSPSWDTQITYQKWIHKNIFSKFVAGLDVPDGTGKTYLDRTGLVHILENGEDGVLHNLNDAYVICAGKMNGYFNNGFFYDYNTISSSGMTVNLPLNCLWNQILQGGGLSPVDYLTPGQEGGGFGFSSYTWGPGFYNNGGFYPPNYKPSAAYASGLLPFMKTA
jgi:Protein of unknown function (DUF1552)